jgi:hypothetical protein
MPDLSDRESQFHAQIRRDREIKEKSYRAQALKILPHLCGSCGREFSGKRLSELTVHHKDHDHTHNPTDGSNWELLCLYCHDNEHEKFRMKGFGSTSAGRDKAGPSLYNPFDKLDTLLKKPE